MSSLRKLSIESLHHQYDIPLSIHLQYCTDESTFPQPSEQQFQICVTLGQIHSGLCLPISKNPLLFDYLMLLQQSAGQFNGNFYRTFHSLHLMNLRHRGLRDALKREKLEKNQPYTKEDDFQYPVWTCQDVLDAFDLRSVSSSQNLFWYLRKKSKGLPLPIEIVTASVDKDWRKFPLLISGNWYDGTDAIPSEGRQIEWLWRVNKEGADKASFYDFSLLSSAKVFKDPNSMHASRIQKARVCKASASSLTKSSEQRDVSHGTSPACPPPDPETSPVLVEHKCSSSQNGPLLNGVVLDFSDELQAEFNSEMDLESLFNDSLAPNRSSLFPASQSVTKRKGSYSDAMVSKRQKCAHPSEPKGVEDVPPDPFGDGIPFNTSVKGDNDVDAPQGPNKATTPDLNVAHAPLSPEIVGSSIPAQNLTSGCEENSIFSPRFSFDGGSPILSSMSGIKSVDVAAAIMQNISLPTDGEAHVLDGLHDRNVFHALYLVNAAFQGNASYVKKLHAELNKVKKDKEVLSEGVAKLQSLVSIKETYQSIASCLENLNNNGDGGNAEQTSHVRSLELAVSRLQSENDAYKSSVTSLQIDIDRFSQQNARLQEDVTKSTNAYALLLKEKDALHSSHDELIKEQDALLGSYDTLLNDKAALQTAYDDLVASSTENKMHLISTNNSLMSTNADLECKIRSLTDQCSSLHQEDAERHSNLSVSINSLEKELVHLKSGFERDKLVMESKHKREMDDTSEYYAKRIQANEVSHVHALNKQRTELETNCRRLVREGAQNTLDNIRSFKAKVANMILSKSYEELQSFAKKLLKFVKRVSLKILQRVSFIMLGLTP